jgi:APA family basic amino acid/polyamine antiporter
MTTPAGAPRQTLSVLQASTMLVGMVLGVFIFQAPTLAAMNTSTPTQFLLLWLAGGIATMIGALCYAELATTYPEEGGEYSYLKRAYGDGAGFLFAWGRMTVIQTGAIAAVAFAFGKYAQVILPLGPVGEGIWGAVAVAGLTAVQLKGLQETANTQSVLTALEVLGLLLIAAIGFTVAKGLPPEPVSAGAANIGLAMVFILLAYGGWNELSYISNDMKDVRRNLAPVLLIGVVVVTVLYLLVNWAYISVFGLAGLRKTFTPAADLVGQMFGRAGATVTAVIICFMALSTINASIFTGGRTTWALGRSFPLFGALGRSGASGEVPVNAILLQGAICLALVALGSTTRNGFEYMVAYTAPVFWLFMIGVGVALFVLRVKDPARERPFRVPLYPLIPALWVCVTAYMFWSSLNYIFGQLWGKMTWGDTGVGAAMGLFILACGIPVYLLGRGRR